MKWLDSARGRGVMIVLWGVLAVQVLTVSLTVYAIARWHPDRRWNPLEDYEEQQADALVEVTPGVPAVVRSHATKCATETVTVIGTYVWQALDPPGPVVQGAPAGGRAVRKAGCVDADYRNPVPAEVVSLTVEVGGGEMVWQIAGWETPVRDVSGEHGVTRDWHTSPIVVRVLTPPGI